MGDIPHHRGRDAATPPLALEVRSRLRADEPLGLLTLVSQLIAIAENGSGDDVDLGLLVETLVAVDSIETTALLSVLSHLLVPDDLRVGVRRALMRRRQPMPSWLRDLDRTDVTDAAIVTAGADVGDTVILGVRWCGGGLATVVVETEVAGSGGVQETRVTPEPWSWVIADYGEVATSPRVRPVQVVDLGAARAVVAQAVARAERRRDPFVSDTWPAARPLLCWILDRMPLPRFTPGPSGGARP